MKKKSIIFYTILFISIGFNVYFGINSYIKSTYTPTLEDQDLLAEMTKMVIDSSEYQRLASKETVYAIKQGVNRYNVQNPKSIFHYEILVKTEKQTYIFTCKDKLCSNVSIGGWNYSRYSEEEPILPLKED